MGVGILLVFMSCIGWAAVNHAERGQKKLMMAYLLLVIGALAAQIAACTFLANYLGLVQLQGENLTISSALEGATASVNDAYLSVYTTCCTGCINTAPQPTVCSNVRPFANTTNAFCPVPPCQVVDFCSNLPADSDNCYVAETTGESKYPPVNLFEDVCNFFETARNGSGVLLVGNHTSGSCGGGDPGIFLIDMTNYWNFYLYYALIGFGVLAAIQALNFVASSYILCIYAPKHHKPGQ